MSPAVPEAAPGRTAAGRAPTSARRVWALNVAVGAAVLGLWIAWVGDAPALAAPVRIPWLVLAAMYCAAEICVVHVHIRGDAHSFSLSEIPLVLGLFFASPGELLLACLAGGAIALWAHRRLPPVKLIFNLGQWGVAVSLAAIAFHAIAGTGEALGPAGWVATFVAIMLTDVVSAVLITGALSLSDGRPRLEAIRGLPRLGLVATLANGVLALMAVTLVWRDSQAVWLLAIAAGVLFLAYRGYATFRQRYGSLELLYESTRVAQQSLEGDAVVPTLLQQACRMFRAERAEVAFFPLSEGAAAVRTTLEAGSEAATVLVQLDPTDGVWARVAAEGQSILISRPIRNERLRTHFGARGIRDAMVAPVFAGSRVAGMISVANRLGSVSTFDAEDLKLFETFANHAGVTVNNAQLVERLVRQAAESEYQALHDALTGLPNRTLLRDRTEQAIRSARRAGESLAVLVMDLDRFKEVNDTLGHHNGDALLQELAARLRATLRDEDTIARLGGDEFAIVLRSIRDPMVALRAAGKIRAALQRPFALQDMNLDVGVSIGIALYPDHGDDPDTLLQRADVAMYLAKEDQSGCEIYAAERDRYSPARLALAGELRGAVERDELLVYFQPQVEMRTGRVVAVEALVRWNHPRRGVILPDEFIPLAEHTGVIGPLTIAVLGVALRRCAEWRRSGHLLGVSVNVSPRSLVDRQLPDAVAALLEETGLPPSALTLEITESSLMSDPTRSSGIVSRLSGMGIGLSIDDFGTGYSSLSHLKRLPVDEIKIDRSFVLGMAADEDDSMIVRSIVDLGRTLGLRVVAEGVETEHEWHLLAAMGCDVAQGHHLSRPVPAEKLTRWLAGVAPARAAHLAEAPREVAAQDGSVVSLRPRR